MKVAGLSSRRLYDDLLRLGFVVSRDRAWPADVDPAAGAWLLTGFDALLRALFAPQPPEGSIADHVGQRVGVLRGHASSSTSLGLFADEPAASWRSLLAGEALLVDDSGDGGARALRLVDEARARLAQTSLGGPSWSPGQLAIGASLKKGLLVVAPSDAPALWTLAQRDRELRAAAIVQGYLFLLPREDIVAVVLQPATWRNLPAEATQRLTDFVVAGAALLDAPQRQALAALAADRPALATRLVEHDRSMREHGPLERLLAARDSDERREVVAGVDAVTGHRPYLLSRPHPVLGRHFVDEIVDGAVASLQKRWTKKPVAEGDDLWDVETFRLAWLVLQAFVVQQWDRAGERAPPGDR